jgi:hypothetical protein
MATQERPYQQTLPWRATSSTTLGIVGFLSRTWLYAFNRTEVKGLDNFLALLDKRKDERNRTRGLITGRCVPSYPARILANSSIVSNHVSMYVSSFNHESDGYI